MGLRRMSEKEDGDVEHFKKQGRESRKISEI